MSAIKPFLSTAEVCRAVNVGRETLRFYEEKGLIEATARTAAGYRQFSPEVIETLRFIKQTQAAGFALKEIHQLLKMSGQGQATCGALTPVFIDKLKQLETSIAAMQLRREALQALLATCSGQDTQQACGFIAKGKCC